MLAAPKQMNGGTSAGWQRGVWLVAVAAACFAPCGVGFGRDLWLEADPVAKPPAKSEERALHLRAGERFVSEEEKPLQKENVGRFDLYADRIERRDLLAAGQSGQTPVAKLPILPGASLVVMDRKEREITLDHDKFNRYLADEGQEAVLAQRARLGQTDQDGKDVHLRCLKTLIPGADPASTLPNTLYKRRVGQRLEILLQNNPNRLPASRKLTIKVLFEGKPLPGAKVLAYPREMVTTGPLPDGALQPSQTAVTSPAGLAEFKLDQNGPWLVRLVHVRAGAERKNNPNGAWESFWASYSFVARGTAALPGTPPPEPRSSAPTAGEDTLE